MYPLIMQENAVFIHKFFQQKISPFPHPPPARSLRSLALIAPPPPPLLKDPGYASARAAPEPHIFHFAVTVAHTGLPKYGPSATAAPPPPPHWAENANLRKLVKI